MNKYFLYVLTVSLTVMILFKFPDYLVCFTSIVLVINASMTFLYINHCDKKKDWDKFIKELKENKNNKEWLLKHEEDFIFEYNNNYLAKKKFKSKLDLVNKALNQFEVNQKNENPKQGLFQLKDKAKTDYIRVINALYCLGYFVDENERVVSKVIVMKQFGQVVKEDLTSYSNLLSQAYKNPSIETNLEIFDLLKSETKKIIEKKLT